MATTAIASTTQTAQGTTLTTDKVAGDKNLFMKLLITQLKNQDPLSPVEDKEFIAQLAQFTSLEKLSSIDASLSSNQSAAIAQQAVSLIGKNVTVLDPDTSNTAATQVEGTVDSVGMLGDAGPTLKIGGKDYPMSWLVTVK